MRNLVITDLSKLSLSSRYVRMVKKNKELVNIALSISEEETTNLDLLREIRENDQIIAVIARKELIGVLNKTLFYQVKLGSKEIENLEDVFSQVSYPRENLVFIIELPENYFRLDKLLEFQKFFNKEEIRFINGNLLKIEGLNTGYFSRNFIVKHFLKLKDSLLNDLTNCVTTSDGDIYSISEEEYRTLLEEEKKQPVKKQRQSSSKKPRSSSSGASPRKVTSSNSSSSGKKSLKQLFKKKI